MEPVVSADKWRWIWMSKKLLLRSFFLEISDHQDSDSTNKSTKFCLNFPLKSYVLYWAFGGGIWTCSCWGMQIWKLGETKKAAIFLKLRFVKNTDVKNTKLQFSHQSILYNWKSVRNRPCWTNKAFSFGEIRVWMSWKTEVEFFLCLRFLKIRILMLGKKQNSPKRINVYNCCICL